MIFPVQKSYKITAPFNEMRPIENPTKHIHGAIDIAVPIGTKIQAPEDGLIYYHFNYSKNNKARNIYWYDKTWYAFSNYFYSIFGGLIILEGISGYTHVFAHIEGKTINDMLNNERRQRKYYEDANGFAFINLEDPNLVIAMDVIGFSGNAGKSTGPHIHYEIHEHRKWIPHKDRPNPEKIYNV